MSQAEFTPTKAWWKEAVIYQIYPLSFFDSNGDGFGDLNGIASKLDYLKNLGVDVLWLSPIYRSPLADMGYDISDYRDIDPRFGTLGDWDNLLKGVHARGMKLMMDLVVNHTSHEHEWFVSSRSSKSDPKRDWYIWRPPKYDSAGVRHHPNNWKSQFQGPAWEYDEATEECYMHIFVTKQPELNWENPDVRQAAYDVMQFWIDRGCDGFRMDVINLLSKADGLPDAPIAIPETEEQPASMHFANGPRIHEFIKEMYEKVLSSMCDPLPIKSNWAPNSVHTLADVTENDIITVGETPFTQQESEIVKYVLPENKELNMVFHFEIMDIDSPKQGQGTAETLRHKPWTLSDLRGIINKWQNCKREEGFWNAVFFENHDRARSVSRFGNESEEWRAISAKMICIMQITQSGTQFVYQGQELALKNFPRSWGIEEYKDPASINYWNQALGRRRKESGKDDVDMSDILDNFQKKARDHSRVPMQWNASAHAGFTTGGNPWMRVNEDYETWNVDAQVNDPNSVHAFWRKALVVRNQYDVLIYGDFIDISRDHPAIFAYVRNLKGAKALVLLNVKEEDVQFDLPDDLAGEEFIRVLGNYDGGDPIGVSTKTVHIRKYEGILYMKK